MSLKVNVPPIKSQGIKTKLVPWIRTVVPADFDGVWVEPFMGTGSVAFNVAAKKSVLCDKNPHLIRFYSSIASGEITSDIVGGYLKKEGDFLRLKGESHYYYIRDRFNDSGDPLDFLFLNRAGFNGMIRFNRKGGFNIPFCRKPERFSQSYVTKIVNQISWVEKIIKTKDIVFKCQDFRKTIDEAGSQDFIYCDPPYIDRHVDYYGGWDDDCEIELYKKLSSFSGRFLMSTWHHNDFRSNDYIDSIWSSYNILTREHFYHVGGKEKNRNPMVEALVLNFDVEIEDKNQQPTAKEQLNFFDDP